MPKFNGSLHEEKLYLPSTEGLAEADQAWVVFNPGIEVGTFVDAEKIQQDGMQLSVFLLSKAITNWNFTDDNNNIEPITPENVRRMSIKDFIFLNKKLDLEGTLTEPDEKKISPVSSGSGPEPEAIDQPAA